MKGLFLAVSVFSVFAASEVSAQTADENWVRKYDCRVKSGSIVVDGVGDEFAWQIAPQVGEFTRFKSANNPNDELTLKNRTTARMLWDEDNLYLLISAEDPDIYSDMTEGDKDCLCLQETIEIFIDPDGDSKNYAELHYNCLGTVNDLCIPQEPGAKGFATDKGEPIDWKAAYAWNVEGMLFGVINFGTVNDKSDHDNGSVFEIALPWKGFGKVAGSANIPPKPGDVWRININRYERPERNKEDNYGWAPLERNSFHVPGKFAYVKFIDKK